MFVLGCQLLYLPAPFFSASNPLYWKAASRSCAPENGQGVYFCAYFSDNRGWKQPLRWRKEAAGNGPATKALVNRNSGQPGYRDRPLVVNFVLLRDKPLDMAQNRLVDRKSV